MSELREPACKPAPPHMMKDASRIVRRRPRYWLTVGMKGIAMSAPREYIALRRPRRLELGLSKSMGLLGEWFDRWVMDKEVRAHSQPMI